MYIHLKDVAIPSAINAYGQFITSNNQGLAPLLSVIELGFGVDYATTVTVNTFFMRKKYNERYLFTNKRNVELISILKLQF